MKKWIIAIIVALCSFLGGNTNFAVADTWTAKTDFGGAALYHPVGFSIGSKGYIGTGYDGSNKKDFWEYDPAGNTWTQKADFSGTARRGAVGFSIGSKGYIGTGNNGSSPEKDFWEYDPVGNTWTQKTDFGGTARYYAVGFSIGSKGYIGTGNNGPSYYKDFWEYDPTANTWTQKTDFGGTSRPGAVGFSIENKGYIGTGYDDGSNKKDFWAYDPVGNTWTHKTDFGGTARHGAVGFSIGSKGYIGTGYDGSETKDFWEYDPDDTTPDAFTFTAQTGMPLGAAIVSNPITVTGIAAAASISITGGEYSVSTNGGTTWSAYSSTTPATVSLNNQVKVRQTSSAVNSTMTTATLTIGGVTADFNVTTAASGDPNASGLISWWKAENNAYDSVGGNNGTPAGGTVYATGKVDLAFSFSGGAGDSVNIPAFNMGTDWTIEGWLYPTGATDGMHNTFFSRSNGNLDGMTINYVGPTHPYANQIGVVIGNGGSSWQLISFSGTQYPLNSWHHVAFSKSGDTYTLYVNGQVKNQQTVAGISTDYQARAINLGHWNYGVSLIGLIDETKIFNRALSPIEISTLAGTKPDAFSFTAQTGMPLSTAIVSNPITVTGISSPAPISIGLVGQYSVSTDGGTTWSAYSSTIPATVSLNNQVKVRQTSSASPSTPTTATLTIGGVTADFNVTTAASGDPNANGLVAWWKAENNAYDSVGGNHGTAVNGATYAAGKVNQAFSFDGADDYFDIANTASLDLGTGDFTIAFWMNLNALTTQDFVHKSVGNVFSGTNKTYFVEYDQDTNSLRFRTSDSSVVNDLEVPVSLATGQWYYVTAVRSGTTNSLYLNGAPIGAQTASGLADTGSGGYFRIGQIAPNGTSGVARYVNGKLDEMKIFNRALSATEVGRLSGIFPDPFTFVTVTGAPLSTSVESNSISVTGTSLSTTISITAGGQYEINGSGTWLSTAGTVSPGASVKVRLTSSDKYSDTKTATLTIGGVEGTFSVTTLVDSEKPQVTGFTLAATESTFMTVAVASFTATDNSGVVSGYLVTASATPPSPADAGWSATALPMTVTLNIAGNNTLYAWAIDPAGNVSDALTATVLLKPVRREPENYYVSLQTAYGEAGSGETIRALAVTLTENIDLNLQRDISISGGYEDGFAGQSGYSTISGSLTVGKGTLIVERVVVK